jgi:hypothetical protein
MLIGTALNIWSSDSCGLMSLSSEDGLLTAGLDAVKGIDTGMGAGVGREGEGLKMGLLASQFFQGSSGNTGLLFMLFLEGNWSWGVSSMGLDC